MACRIVHSINNGRHDQMRGRMVHFNILLLLERVALDGGRNEDFTGK